jgi:hypothetical protein
MEPWTEWCFTARYRGTEFYEQQPRERRVRRVHALAKNAAQLGFQLVPLASLPELSSEEMRPYLQLERARSVRR